MKYDKVLKNVRLVDYELDVDEICDVAIDGGKIAEISKEIGEAKEIFRLDGKLCVPGIIDTHIHASPWLGGKYAHKMLALSGVTTALDMAGPAKGTLELLRDYGCGINLATLEYVRPAHTVKSDNPSKTELKELYERVLNDGGIGVKLLGGHYPLTTEAIDRAIEVGDSLGAYIAFHAGSTKNGSNLNGALEAIELAKNRPLHLAHINAYCRGAIKDSIDEAKTLLDKLAKSPNIFSESYLSPLNGTSAEIINNLPGSNVTATCLKNAGFECSKDGLREAILKGVAFVNVAKGDINVLECGESGVRYWLSKNTDATVSFVINPIVPRVLIATKKDSNNKFIVDAISTDGGGIPRNVIVPSGLALVELGGLSLKEFVLKTSFNPAKRLSLKTKGSLKVGNDADITIIDMEKKVPIMSFIGGNLCLEGEKIHKLPSTLIATEKGEKIAKEFGLKTYIV